MLNPRFHYDDSAVYGAEMAWYRDGVGSTTEENSRTFSQKKTRQHVVYTKLWINLRCQLVVL